MKEMEQLLEVKTIPNTWILLFRLKSNPNKWLYYNSEECFDYPYAKELGIDINEFQNVYNDKTRVSWKEDKWDICIDRLVECGKEWTGKLNSI